jgi:ADP-ribosylation factor-like protein 5B
LKPIPLTLLCLINAGAVLLVYANKQDAADALSAAEISQMLGLDKLKGRSYHIQACCALTGEGL